MQANANTQSLTKRKVVSTDPPYYDNIGYADLSDFFYAWLRRSLNDVYPDLLATLAVPKTEELVATPYRHGSKDKAEKFFLDGMTRAMHQLAVLAHPCFPITIYYAFKQSESKGSKGNASTGWETFLGAVFKSGLTITGTWPMETERKERAIGQGANALASSIVLVCERRDPSASILSRNAFRRELRQRLPKAIRELEHANIAPVDVAQAAIGPGMAIFSQAKAVLNPDDSPMSVREALIEINAALDEYLSEEEGSFDADKLIIPFRTEPIEPENEFEYYLAKTHWFDAFGSNNDDDFELLSERVLRNLDENARPSRQSSVVAGLSHSLACSRDEDDARPRCSNTSTKESTVEHDQLETPSTPLQGDELVANVKALGDSSKADLVRSCGYASSIANHGEYLDFAAFYEALLKAKGFADPGLSDEEKEVMNLHETARARFDEGDYEVALEELDRALRNL